MIWYLAVCQDCEPVLPQPFWTRTESETWANAHSNAAQHHVKLVEERWAAPPPETAAP